MFAELSEDVLSPAARDTRDDVGGASGGGKLEGKPTLEPHLMRRPVDSVRRSVGWRSTSTVSY
jgi:hypothetical protein